MRWDEVEMVLSKILGEDAAVCRSSSKQTNDKWEIDPQDSRG